MPPKKGKKGKKANAHEQKAQQKILDGLLREGNELQQSGRPADALAKYDEILASAPTHASALYNKGLVQMEMGEAHNRSDLLAEALNNFKLVVHNDTSRRGETAGQSACAAATVLVLAAASKKKNKKKLDMYTEACKFCEQAAAIQQLGAHSMGDTWIQWAELCKLMAEIHSSEQAWASAIERCRQHTEYLGRALMSAEKTGFTDLEILVEQAACPFSLAGVMLEAEGPRSEIYELLLGADRSMNAALALLGIGDSAAGISASVAPEHAYILQQHSDLCATLADVEAEAAALHAQAQGQASLTTSLGHARCAVASARLIVSLAQPASSASASASLSLADCLFVAGKTSMRLQMAGMAGNEGYNGAELQEAMVIYRQAAAMYAEQQQAATATATATVTGEDVLAACYNAACIASLGGADDECREWIGRCLAVSLEVDGPQATMELQQEIKQDADFTPITKGQQWFVAAVTGQPQSASAVMGDGSQMEID